MEFLPIAVAIFGVLVCVGEARELGCKSKVQTLLLACGISTLFILASFVIRYASVSANPSYYKNQDFFPASWEGFWE